MKTINYWKVIMALVVALCMVIPGRFLRITVQAEEPVQVVVTIFPAYDWTMNILGDAQEEAEVTWLFDSGVDPHSYQPSMEDIMKIESCDLLICVGGESESWIDEALAHSENADRKIVRLLEVLGDLSREEEYVEGMQIDEDASAESETESDTAYDEHVWLSLKNAELFCYVLCEYLQELCPDHAQEMEEQTTLYIDELKRLDDAYTDVTSQAERKTLLFGDRFPFLYLTGDYGLDYYAAFDGCSAETEAGFDTIIFLAQKIDELQLPCVLIIDGSDGKIAETIVQSTTSRNQEILTMNSLQSVTRQDYADGETYLTAMEQNLSVLEQALSSGTS